MLWDGSVWLCNCGWGPFGDDSGLEVSPDSLAWLHVRQNQRDTAVTNMEMEAS